jgi:drug/metabolite transporter (DMT)-like permease
MWGLSSNLANHLHSSLPPITFNSALYLIVALIGLRAIIQKILIVYFHITQPRPQHHINTLEYSYFYHLSIVVLVLA